MYPPVYVTLSSDDLQHKLAQSMLLCTFLQTQMIYNTNWLDLCFCASSFRCRWPTTQTCSICTSVQVREHDLWNCGEAYGSSGSGNSTLILTRNKFLTHMTCTLTWQVLKLSFLASFLILCPISSVRSAAMSKKLCLHRQCTGNRTVAARPFLPDLHQAPSKASHPHKWVSYALSVRADIATCFAQTSTLFKSA